MDDADRPSSLNGAGADGHVQRGEGFAGAVPDLRSMVVGRWRLLSSVEWEDGSAGFSWVDGREMWMEMDLREARGVEAVERGVRG